MSEAKRHRYPRDAGKLREMRIRLENEIAERQIMLSEVRKLEVIAEKESIFNMVKTYNVTPEELARLMEVLRNQLPNPENAPRETPVPVDEPLRLDEYEIETEENEDE